MQIRRQSTSISDTTIITSANGARNGGLIVKLRSCDAQIEILAIFGHGWRSRGRNGVKLAVVVACHLAQLYVHQVVLLVPLFDLSFHVKQLFFNILHLLILVFELLLIFKVLFFFFINHALALLFQFIDVIDFHFGGAGVAH